MVIGSCAFRNAVWILSIRVEFYQSIDQRHQIDGTTHSEIN